MKWGQIAALALVLGAGCGGRILTWEFTVFSGDDGTAHCAAQIFQNDEGGGGVIGFTYARVGEEGIQRAATWSGYGGTPFRVVADGAEVPYLIYGSGDRGILALGEGGWAPLAGVGALSAPLASAVVSHREPQMWRADDGVVRLLYPLTDGLAVLELDGGAVVRELPVSMPLDAVRGVAATPAGRMLAMAFETAGALSVQRLDCGPTDCAWTEVGTLPRSSRPRFPYFPTLVVTEAGSPWVIDTANADGADTQLHLLGAAGDVPLPEYQHVANVRARALPEGGFVVAVVTVAETHHLHLLFFDESGTLQAAHLLREGAAAPEIFVRPGPAGRGVVHVFIPGSFSVAEMRVDSTGVLDERTFELARLP